VTRPVLLLIALLAFSCRPAGNDAILPAEPRPIPGKAAVPAALPPPRIQELYPHDAAAGVGFDIEFDGASPMGVAGDGFSPRSTIFFGDQPLVTRYGSRRALVGMVTPELLSRVRSVKVTVQDAGPPRRESPSAIFEVRSARKPGACPRIKALYPSFTRVSSPFGAQPDGSSALGVAGEDFGPKTVVTFGGVELNTKYQGPSSLVAFLPPDLIRRPGALPVALTDPECRSPKNTGMKFEIRP
jgi:hypothetical protein